MTRGRLEAFSDAVIAILMTIMVLDLRPPAGSSWQQFIHSPVVAKFFTYLLSFVILAIYWNNHHHMLSAADRVNGKILWANMHLLFWLSLFPFCTAWLGAHHAAAVPAALYGVALLGAAIAFFFLKTAIVSEHGPDSRIAKALGDDFKGKISIVLYAIAIPLATVSAYIAIGIYAFVAVVWFVPDRRIERTGVNE